VAFLTNYCQTFSVNIGRWDIGLFKNALDYYLNDNFNLNKVMVFSKFYV